MLKGDKDSIPKLILLGGASSSGKTAFTRRLTRDFCIPNLRFHNYLLDYAKREGIDPIANWNNISPIAMRALLRDCNLEVVVSSERHFAIQPKLDTAYAKGLKIEEDINEPYVKGFEDDLLRMPEFSEIDIRMILVDAETDELLRRRERRKNSKKPRSLNRLSIQREREFERKYFFEAAKTLGVGDRARVLVNSEGRFDQVYEQLKDHCNLR